MTRSLLNFSPQAVDLFGNERARDHALISCDASVSPHPTRFDFSLTELCNLRCVHCITHAPEKTRDKTARTLTHSLLDRLRPHFFFANYFGFVHGGESLSAPIFFDVLDAIRAQRRGLPTVVHLLTNGVLLTETTTRKLIDRGVRSLSVSLDGAAGSTNDSIRIGGRFYAVVRNLRQAVRIRRDNASGDLRVGISFVIMQQNVSEVTRIVELAADIGVDWIKLEELAPANALCQNLTIDPASPELRDAVETAKLRATELGIVLVDHAAPPKVWRCQLDSKAAEFLAADEFANRSEIHPCRAMLDHACIEPNGDVRAGDFFGPILGNIADRDLMEIWSCGVIQSERRRLVSERICGHGPVTCVSAEKIVNV